VTLVIEPFDFEIGSMMLLEILFSVTCKTQKRESPISSSKGRHKNKIRTLALAYYTTYVNASEVHL
jgi:hypothetical protein